MNHRTIDDIFLTCEHPTSVSNVLKLIIKQNVIVANVYTITQITINSSVCFMCMHVSLLDLIPLIIENKG